MIVYILTDNVNQIRLWQLKNMIPAKCNCEVQVVTSMNNLNINKDTIISTSVNGQFTIFQPFLKYNIYNMLDDKISFYNYLRQNPDLLTGMPLIPSYDETYKGPAITKQFIIKQKNGWSSRFNTYVTDNVYNLIQQFGKTHQIQDVLDIKHIYGVNLCIFFGKIIGVYTNSSFGGLTPEMNAKGFPAILTNFIKYKEVRDFLKKIIKTTNYQGIVEFEFLIDKNDKIYIMECNPRLSGALRDALYFDNVVKKYITALHTKQFNEVNIDDETLWK